MEKQNDFTAKAAPETNAGEDDYVLPEISWQARRLTSQTTQRINRYLYIGLFALALLFLIFGPDILGAITFIFFGSWVWYKGRLEAPTVEYAINSAEVRVGTTVYPLREIQSFWIQYEPEFGIQELSIHLKRWASPYVKIPLGDVDPVQVHSILIDYIPEEVHEETFLDLISRIIG